MPSVILAREFDAPSSLNAVYSALSRLDHCIFCVVVPILRNPGQRVVNLHYSTPALVTDAPTLRDENRLLVHCYMMMSKKADTTKCGTEYLIVELRR